MPKLANITEKYMSFSLRSESINPFPVLRAHDAICFIAEGVKNECKLLGLEGFHVSDEGQIQPDQRLSLDICDYSTLSQIEFTTKVVMKLLECIHEECIAFEVVFAG